MTETETKFSFIQKIGRSLMLPIAVLPVAGLLLRLGQNDILEFFLKLTYGGADKISPESLKSLQAVFSFVGAAGGAIFDNLGFLFAIGIAIGFAKESHGAAGLSGAVGFLVATSGMKAILASRPVLEGTAAIDPAKAAGQMSIPIGILVGLVAGAFYNKYKDIKLPEFLAFFGGRRFVPIITGFAALFFAALFGYGYPYLSEGLDLLSKGVETSGNIGLFLYGFFNRILIVTGLHHILNNVAWFLLGDYNGVTGDLRRFFEGDPSAGAFMAGFFPVMMFGLPAACLAMFLTAPKEKQKTVGGVLFSMGLTSFLTGITEPIEYSFMFLAPVLYLIHAVLTGLSLVIMNVLNVKLGFGFSAGLFDYLINWNKATNPGYLIPIGLIYFILYFAIFYIFIKKFNLQTMGRETETVAASSGSSGENLSNVVSQTNIAGQGAKSLGAQYIQALGGAQNIQSIDSCTTRLRLVVQDSSLVDDNLLKSIGARGVLKPTQSTVQVIIGAHVEQVENELKEALQAASS